MKKPALKIVLALGLIIALVFSFATVAFAKTDPTVPPMPIRSSSGVYSSCSSYTHNTSWTINVDKVWEPYSSISNVLFSTWLNNDTKNTKTFSGTRDGDNWRVLVSTGLFNTWGKYHTNVYGVDALNRKGLIGGITVIAAPTNITATAQSFYAAPAKNGAFYVYVKGASNDAGDVAKINLRVYANGLQSTEKWIPMNNIGKDTWRVQVNIKDFANYHGWYTLQAYSVNSVGAQGYISTIYEKVP